MEINNSAITKESVISNNEYDSKPLFTDSQDAQFQTGLDTKNGGIWK